MAYRKGMKISKREMRSLQNSFGKTPFFQQDSSGDLINQVKEGQREIFNLTNENVGRWDRAWLQQMGLLSIFFESPNNPKPVTVLDPQTEEMYRCFVYEQELEIFRRKEIERQERLARLPKDPRKRKSSEQQPAENKRRNIEASAEQEVVATTSSPSREEIEKKTREKPEAESTFQSEDYRQYKNNLQFRQQIAQLVDESDSEESAMEIPNHDVEDVFIPGLDDDSDETADGFNMQSIEDEVETIEENSTDNLSEMDSTLKEIPPKTSPTARRSWYNLHQMLESSDDEDYEEENATIIKKEDQVNTTEIAKQQPDDASDDDDDIQFVSETIVID